MTRFLPPDEPVKLYETCFEDDLLGRVKFGATLSEILERIEDPLVVALNGRWGTGKSYFLKRWVGAHRIQNGGKALTVYFDAFAHDYLSDPLIGLVGALSERIPKEEKPKLDRIKKTAIKFVRPATRIGLNIATFGAKEALDELGDAVVEAIKGEAERTVDDLWKREEGRRAAMADFHSAIKALTVPEKEDEQPRPLIIVIDELDRCRPDYALEVLEIIKHFFDVEHVHFVLGANLTALENSVKVRYGSEIDATSYLQKFLSFTLTLPDDIGDPVRTPAIERYVEHLGEMMGTPNRLLEEIQRQLKVLARNNHTSIRDVGKIMSTAALLPSEVQENRIGSGSLDALVTLIITRVIKTDLFPKLRDASVSHAELVNYLGAQEQYITEELSHGNSNPSYVEDVRFLYSLWSFIQSGGAAPEDEGMRRQLRSAFGNYGYSFNIREIPQSIHRRWLSVFKLD